MFEIKTELTPPIAETDLLEFRPSAIHGIGGFAKCDIPQGTRLLQYLGETISKAESLRRCEENNQYLFALDDEHDLDGDVPWNPTRFINHSCAPNGDAELHAGQVWLVVRRDIRAGEELSFNYGYDLVDYQDHPCRCGAPQCVGFIVAEEFFEHVRNATRLKQKPLIAADTR